jgi:ubiquitin domain-containing protein
MNTYLHESFGGCPGKRYVVTGHFEFHYLSGGIIKKIAWEKTVQPQMEVEMVMTTSIVRKSGTFCQRCLAMTDMRFASYDKTSLSWSCHSCGLHNLYESLTRQKGRRVRQFRHSTDEDISVESGVHISNKPKSSNPVVDVRDIWEYALFKPLFSGESNHWAMTIFGSVQREIRFNGCESKGYVGNHF